MRTRKEIEEKVERIKKSLSRGIDYALAEEKSFDKRHKDLENEIKSLQAETPLEETFRGRTIEFSNQIQAKINEMLWDFTQVTGVEVEAVIKTRKDKLAKDIYPNLRGVWREEKKNES